MTPAPVAATKVASRLRRRPGGRAFLGPCAALAIAAAVAAAMPAAAQSLASSFDAVRGELQTLEGDVKVLAQAVPPAGSPADGAAMARLAVRLNQLELDLRSATGKVEELGFQVKRLEARMDKLAADVDYRLGERAGGPAVAAASPVPAAPVPSAVQPPPLPPAVPAPGGSGPRVLGQVPAGLPATPPPAPAAPPASVAAPPPQQTASATQGTPREQYTQAFGLMQKSNYAEAEVAFSEFLGRHPDDPLAENARYWLGESYYVRGNYAKAAETFLDGYEKNKKGQKAPDTLLKLGMSLANLNKTKEACATYREIGRAFADAPQAIKDKAVQEQQKLKCS